MKVVELHRPGGEYRTQPIDVRAARACRSQPVPRSGRLIARDRRRPAGEYCIRLNPRQDWAGPKTVFEVCNEFGTPAQEA
jgi:hypothetical protein